MRGGTYDEELWTKYTGKTVSDRGDEWKKDVETQLASGDSTNKTN
jgi:hypothetical protein